MKMAIDEARNDARPVKVGAVVVRAETVIGTAHGGEISADEHAEYAVLERKLIDQSVRGATLYTTLEPCTITYHPTNPRKTCVEIIKERMIDRVVIGIRDPNPDIYGTGEQSLKKHGIEVDYFPKELTREIESLMSDWIQQQRNRRQIRYEQMFARLEETRSPRISHYSGVAHRDNFSLRICPDITDGWSMSEIKLHLDDKAPEFHLPAEYRDLYEDYFHEHYDTKGFHIDNPKIMLRCYPRSFSDEPTLILHAQKTLYSHVQFYKDMIANDSTKSDPLIQKLVVGEDRVAEFPHALCLHMVVVTNDGKVLITKRAPDVEYYPNTWSCSIEENMALKDLEDGAEGAALRWVKRALLEELGLTEAVYRPDNFRILSVFLEVEILNVSLCGHAVLDISSEQLDRIIRALPRPDYEFTAWNYLQHEDAELIAEILSRSRPYHPTSGYRMLMALMKKNGIPSGSETFFR